MVYFLKEVNEGSPLSLFLDSFLILLLVILPSNLGSEVLIIRLFLLVHLVLMLLVAQ